jgi:hypothetical protein
VTNNKNVNNININFIKSKTHMSYACGAKPVVGDLWPAVAIFFQEKTLGNLWVVALRACRTCSGCHSWSLLAGVDWWDNVVLINK